MFNIITWSVILYIVVIASVIIGAVLIRMRNNKRRKAARQRGVEESLRIKKRQARRLLNKHQIDFSEESVARGREVLNKREK